MPDDAIERARLEATTLRMLLAASGTNLTAEAGGMINRAFASFAAFASQQAPGMPSPDLLERVSKALSDHAGDVHAAGYLTSAALVYELRDEVDRTLSAMLDAAPSVRDKP